MVKIKCIVYSYKNILDMTDFNERLGRGGGGE